MASHAHSHTHSHSAHAHSGHGHDFTAANRAYFDENADKLEEMHPQWRAMARKQVEAMVAAWPERFDKERTAAMDFACGIGLVSENLYERVKSVVGVDISQKSVDRYNALAATLARKPEEMQAVCVELKGEPGELDGARFDLIVCCASYHHFASIDDITRVLASLLNPGGALLVADIKAAEDDSKLFPDTHDALVTHTHGISAPRIRAAFEGAGLAEFDVHDVTLEARMPFQPEGAPPLTWFVARGVKPLA